MEADLRAMEDSRTGQTSNNQVSDPAHR